MSDMHSQLEQVELHTSGILVLQVQAVRCLQVTAHTNHLQLALLKLGQLLITCGCLQQQPLPTVVTTELPQLAPSTPSQKGDKLMEAIMAAGKVCS